MAFVVIMRIAFRGHLEVPDERREAALERTEENAITDRPLLVKSLIVAGATIVGFLFHSAIGVEPATIALLGAMVLMLVAGLDPHRTLREIEWSTLFFFVGLFILVEGDRQAGIVGGIADRLAEATQGQPAAATHRPAVVLGDRVGDHRQHPLHRDGDPGRPAPERDRHRRSSRCGGRWRSAPASAAT